MKKFIAIAAATVSFNALATEIPSLDSFSAADLAGAAELYTAQIEISQEFDFESPEFDIVEFEAAVEEIAREIDGIDSATVAVAINDLIDLGINPAEDIDHNAALNGDFGETLRIIAENYTVDPEGPSATDAFIFAHFGPGSQGYDEGFVDGITEADLADAGITVQDLAAAGYSYNAEYGEIEESGL